MNTDVPIANGDVLGELAECIGSMTLLRYARGEVTAEAVTTDDWLDGVADCPRVLVRLGGTGGQGAYYVAAAERTDHVHVERNSSRPTTHHRDDPYLRSLFDTYEPTLVVAENVSCIEVASA